MDDQVERMVERTNAHHDTNRLMLCEGDTAGRRCVQVHGNDGTGFASDFFDADVQTIDATVYFD
ncbi:hypothetical protein D3C73_1577840 [compost metagenome]